MAEKIKVAVLGGGIAGLTAAFELTETEALRERYDVSVYTLDWRLGGKGASSRNPRAGDRIEEHGLHVWFGFYDNAFDLMRRAYEALAPEADLAEHFMPCDEIVLAEQWRDRWVLRGFCPPSNGLRPGLDAGGIEFWQALDSALEWIVERWADLGSRYAPGLLRAVGTAARTSVGWLVDRRPGDHPDGLRLVDVSRDVASGALAVTTEASVAASRASRRVPGLGRAAGAADVLLRRQVEWVIDEDGDRRATIPHVVRRLSARRAAGGRPLGQKAHTPVVADLLSGFTRWFRDVWLEQAIEDDDVRLFYYAVDCLSAFLRGVVREDLAQRGLGAIDDRDLRDWLGEHGADPRTLQHAPFLRGFYDLTFAYQDGDLNQPRLAAGKALQAFIRLAYTYKGALAYKARDGLGETVFAPLYEVLRARGVRFHFFNEVEDVEIDAAERLVTRVTGRRRDGLDDYAPLVDGSWPGEPPWRVAGTRTPRWRAFALERGTDFDEVVLAISGGSLQSVCGRLAAVDSRFASMLQHTHTVATQAMQLWLTRPLRDSGWPYRSNTVLSAYAGPLSTYAGMAHLLGRERWPADAGVQDVAYLCGVLQPDVAPIRRPHATREALSFIGAGAVSGGVNAAHRFDWTLLAVPDATEGERRAEQQYYRANVAPAERYVTTYPGTVAHRLAPDESGFQNLKLAGDWTRNGIDGGCMEAAVVSGRLAARAISGVPAEVPGTSGWLVGDGWSNGAAPPRRYVRYGGLTTIPSPYRSEGAVLHGFWARGDRAKLEALCRKVFAAPSGGAADYRPIGDLLMLTWGQIPVVRSLDPEYASLGTVWEDQVAVWVPVVRVDERGLARSFAMFVPYIWLENPMSLTTGREVLGYAKTWGRCTFPAEDGSGVCSVRVFGLARLGDRAGEHPLLDVVPAAGFNAGEALGSLYDAALDAGRALLVGDDGIALGPDVALDLLGDVAQRELKSVFLKQVPDVEGTGNVPLQQIVETTYAVRRFSARVLLGEYQLTVHRVDSQPLWDELGLQDQALGPAYRCEMDFDVRDSQVLWRA